MRGAAALLPLALIACSGGGAGAEEAGERIACALGGSDGFTEDCTLERTTQDGAPLFIVRHSDGAFRRFEASRDGQNLLAADGAQVTQSALKGDRWEVILGEDRYVIPVRADAARK